MAQHRADKAERDDRHDDEGPAEIGEHPGEDDIDRDQPGDRARAHVGGRFGLFLGLPLEPVAETVALRDVRQPAIRDRREQGAEAGDRLVDLSRYRDLAGPVLAAQARETALLAERHDLAQRHLGAVRRTQKQVEERRAVGAPARIAHLDLDFLVAPGEALGDRALERVSHLQPGALGGKAERLSARRHFQDQLLLAKREIVVDGTYAREAPQQALDLRRRRLEVFGGAAAQADVDFPPRGAAGARVDVDLLDIGQWADLLAPCLDEFVRADVAFVRRNQLHRQAAILIADDP